MWENQKSVVVNFQSLERYTKESCRYLQNLLHQASVELYEANFLPFFEKKSLLHTTLLKASSLLSF